MIRRHTAGIALAILFAATSASAQSEQALKAAQLRFREGVALYKKADYEAARVAFAQAYAVLHSPDVLLNLALAELNGGGHSLEALEHLRMYAMDPKADRAVVKDKLPALIERASREIGHLKLVDAPAGATIAIDGRIVQAPIPDVIDVSAGKHVVEARVQDKTLTAEVVAVAGEMTPVKFGAVPATPPAASVPASTPPPANSAVAPATPMPADSATPPPSPGFWTTRRFIGVAVTGAGLVAIGAGAHFGSVSNDAADRANVLQATVGKNGCATTTQQCTDLRDAHDSANRNQTLGLVFVTAGIATAATGLILVLWPQSNQTAVAPMVSPSAAGLQLHGAF